MRLVVSLGKWDISTNVVLFQLHGDMVTHMQVLATPSSTVHNTTWIPTTEAILVLAACS